MTKGGWQEESSRGEKIAVAIAGFTLPGFIQCNNKLAKTIEMSIMHLLECIILYKKSLNFNDTLQSKSHQNSIVYNIHIKTSPMQLDTTKRKYIFKIQF